MDSFLLGRPLLPNARSMRDMDCAATTLRPRPLAQRKRTASLIDVDLDPTQRDAVALPAGRALLVLGEAGHGKTTVALHRLAHLWRARARADAGTRVPAGASGPPRMAVVVPAEGLARLIQPLLRRLGIDVEVLTFDRWAAAQARRKLRGLPRRESEQGGPLVARLKRDPAVRVGLSELAQRPPARIDDDDDAPPHRSRGLVGRGDLQHLFGDRVLLESMARTSGSITPRMIEEVLEHTRVQFSRTAEQEWSDVTDRERLVSVDERPMDEGTAANDAGTIDVEDYSVLFELDRVRAALLGQSPAAPRPYDVIALDEAQEFAPLELALLGRSLAPGGTMVVAGDVDQQTDPTTTFSGWEPAMRELGCAEYTAVQLDIGYRCPPGIARLARGIVGAPASASGPRSPHPRAIREGIEPAHLAFASEKKLTDWFGTAISALRRSDPRASVVVLCRAAATAQRLAAALRGMLPIRLVFDGRFLARGPVQITVVDEVKGLEFDFVLVPDASETHYPDTPAARRALYVAATRARHQLVFASVGAPTRILDGLAFVDGSGGTS
jgi:DNA helicase-2/ATP-dependent DNA helicase PcrA